MTVSFKMNPPPYPPNPHSGEIELPWKVVHELYHLVVDDGNEPEAVRRLRELTGVDEKRAKAYVQTLAQRR